MSTIYPGQLQVTGHSMGVYENTHVHTAGKRVFSGFVEVRQVVNGYVVSITSGESRLADMHIAQNITQVNEIIATAMVAFQLENP